MCQYLDRLDTIGTSARQSMLVNYTNATLRRSHTDTTKPAPTVGQYWSQRFLDAHPEYHMRKQKT